MTDPQTPMERNMIAVLTFIFILGLMVCIFGVLFKLIWL